MEYRFFKTNDAGVLNEASLIDDHNNKCFEETQSFLKTVGAVNAYGGRFGISGIHFKDAPCDKVWRKSKAQAAVNLYLPKKNNKEGKAIDAAIRSIPRHKDLASIVECEQIGISSYELCLIDGRAAYSCQAWRINGEIYFRIPWKFGVEREIEEYNNQEEPRSSWSSELAYLSWVKPDCVKELKEWEFLRDAETWNELLESRKTKE